MILNLSLKIQGHSQGISFMNASQNGLLACCVTISYPGLHFRDIDLRWRNTGDHRRMYLHCQILQLIGFLLCSCPWFALGSLPDSLFAWPICSTFSCASGSSCLRGLLPVDWVKINSFIVHYFVSLWYPVRPYALQYFHTHTHTHTHTHICYTSTCFSYPVFLIKEYFQEVSL